MDNKLLEESIFLIKDQNQAYIFAPLHRKVIRITAVPSEQELEQILDQHIRPVKTITPDRKTEFSPNDASMFLTSDCQLECVYCYGNAGDTKVKMDTDIAEATIDFIISNAKANDEKSTLICLHGGGEPTHAWSLFKHVVNYAKQENARHGLKDHITLSTNGMLTEIQRKFLADNLHRAQVSFDGPPDIQAKQRPPLSPDIAIDTIKYFSERGFPFNIRATITDDSVERMPEILQYFHEIGTPDAVHFEPVVTEFGRCRSNSVVSSPDSEAYIRRFTEVLGKGQKTVCSAGDIARIKDNFCGATGENFCVTPEGYVSSCFEVTLKSDPRSEMFFYGQYDKDNKVFAIDEDKRLALAGLNKRDEECDACFIQHSCAGGCPAKDGDVSSRDYQCDVSKGISLNKIKRLADAGEQTISTTNDGLVCTVTNLPELNEDIESILMWCGCGDKCGCYGHDDGY